MLIAYDRDGAGDRGAAQVAGELAALGLRAYRVNFPLTMDANKVAVTMPPAAASLGRALRHATWMGETRSDGDAGARIVVQSGEAEQEAGPAPSFAAPSAVVRTPPRSRSRRR